MLNSNYCAFFSIFLLGTITTVCLGQEPKPEGYYLSAVTFNNDTGKKEILYLRALTPGNKQYSDVILDEYTGLGSSQWDLKKKSSGDLFGLYSRTNRDNTIFGWGGEQRNGKTGYIFEATDESDVYLIQRKHPKAKVSYLRHNGEKDGAMFPVVSSLETLPNLSLQNLCSDEEQPWYWIKMNRSKDQNQILHFYGNSLSSLECVPPPPKLPECFK